MNLGFLGAGAMGGAMAATLRTLPEFKSVTLCGARDGTVEKTAAQVGGKCRITYDSAELLATTDVTVLALKPHIAEAVLPTLTPHFKKDHLLLSVMAGLNTSTIRSLVGPAPRLMRCMPNTPVMVQCGVTPFSRAPGATDADVALVKKMCEAMGFAEEVPEDMLHAVTGISGSGPAMCAVFLEALADGAVMQGIPRPLALKLAAHTLYGTGALAAKANGGEGMHPAVLKDSVCSPGGTSIHGVNALEQAGLRGSVMNAVGEAVARSKALGASSVPAVVPQMAAAPEHQHHHQQQQQQHMYAQPLPAEHHQNVHHMQHRNQDVGHHHPQQQPHVPVGGPMPPHLKHGPPSVAQHTPPGRVPCSVAAKQTPCGSAARPNGASSVEATAEAA